jgi:hypothetical protein|tara:strand:+ start:969 stop:1178 length:210 start_codon:yes stop_codon:yes gene_type:complete
MAKFDPKKADLNKDGKLSSYEKKRGMAMAKNMRQGGPVNVGVREVKAILTKTKGTGAATQGLNFHKQPD